MNLPTLNMVGWSILDYELAFDGIRHLNDASLWLQNQPRSYDERRHEYHPGAAFIVTVGEGWCASMLDDLIESLSVIRFPVADDDERRVKLLLQYHADYGAAGEPLAAILAMVKKQTEPA